MTARAVDRWAARLALAAVIVIPFVVCVGALVWTDAFTINGSGGFFAWGMYGGMWEAFLVALLAARLAFRRSSAGVRRVVYAVGAAMLVGIVYIAVLVLVAQVDPVVQHPSPDLECGLTDNSLGCHNDQYLEAAVVGLFAEIFLLGVLCVGIVVEVVRRRARGPLRWSSQGRRDGSP